MCGAKVATSRPSKAAARARMRSSTGDLLALSQHDDEDLAPTAISPSAGAAAAAAAAAVAGSCEGPLLPFLLV